MKCPNGIESTVSFNVYESKLHINFQLNSWSDKWKSLILYVTACETFPVLDLQAEQKLRNTKVQ